MPDEPSSATSRCPWCSAVIPAGSEVCPACGAALVASADGGVPGVTAIDTDAVLRSRSAGKSRGGLLGFLSGETGDTVDAPTAAEMSSLAPPGADVRIEMMRLELEAERQRIEAEVAEAAAEAATEEGAAIPAGLFGDGHGAAEVPSTTPPGPEPAPAVPPPPGPERKRRK